MKKLYLRSQLPIQFAPSDKIELFEQYLSTTLDGVTDVVEMVQQMLGYCLIYQYPIHAWFLLVGKGGNGKGTLLHVMRGLLGEQNYASLNFSNFNRFSTPALQSKLLCITDEFPGTANWELLKCLTGGGRTEAERKFKGHFCFESTAKFVFTANEYPFFSDSSVGFWDRARIIPFPNKFRQTDDEVVNFEKDLALEKNGIGYWAIKGLFSLLHAGKFSNPKSCTDAVQKARLQSDSVRSFVDERVIRHSKLAVVREDLYRAYRYYCKAANLKPFSRLKFGRRLEDMGVEVGREHPQARPRRNIYIGISFDRRMVDNDWSAVENLSDNSDCQQWRKLCMLSLSLCLLRCR